MKMIRVKREYHLEGDDETIREECFYINPKYISSIKWRDPYFLIKMHDGYIHDGICIFEEKEITHSDSVTKWDEDQERYYQDGKDWGTPVD